MRNVGYFFWRALYISLKCGHLLINKTIHLADSDFIIRMIYKDMY